MIAEPPTAAQFEESLKLARRLARAEGHVASLVQRIAAVRPHLADTVPAWDRIWLDVSAESAARFLEETR